MNANHQITSGCQACPLRARAERKPASFIAKFWRWHTKWCPGWKKYIRELENKGIDTTDALRSARGER